MKSLLDRGTDILFNGVTALAENPIWLNSIASYMLKMISPVSTAQAASCPGPTCWVVRSTCSRDLSCISYCGRYRTYYQCTDGTLCSIKSPCSPSCRTSPC